MPIGNASVAATGINLELGRSSNATLSIDTAENGGYGTINTCSPSYPSGSNPASFSEWRNYNHGFACCNAPSISAGNIGSNSLGFSVSYSNCSAMHYEYSTNGSTWNSGTGGCASYITISSLSSSTTYYIRVRITCASTNSYSGYSNTITMTTSGSYPPYGTLLSNYCSGCTLYYRFADGSGGTYDVSQGCSTGCGGCCCAPSYGTYLYAGCSGCDYGVYYANGCYGSYFSLLTPNHPDCGCGGSVDCYWGWADGGGYQEFTTCDGFLVQLYEYDNRPIDYCIDFSRPSYGVYHNNQSCNIR
jgi:hypothetical protein